MRENGNSTIRVVKFISIIYVYIYTYNTSAYDFIFQLNVAASIRSFPSETKIDAYVGSVVTVTKLDGVGRGGGGRENETCGARRTTSAIFFFFSRDVKSASRLKNTGPFFPLKWKNIYRTIYRTCLTEKTTRDCARGRSNSPPAGSLTRSIYKKRREKNYKTVFTSRLAARPAQYRSSCQRVLVHRFKATFVRQAFAIAHSLLIKKKLLYIPALFLKFLFIFVNKQMGNYRVAAENSMKR